MLPFYHYMIICFVIVILQGLVQLVSVFIDYDRFTTHQEFLNTTISRVHKGQGHVRYMLSAVKSAQAYGIGVNDNGCGRMVEDFAWHLRAADREVDVLLNHTHDYTEIKDRVDVEFAGTGVKWQVWVWTEDDASGKINLDRRTGVFENHARMYPLVKKQLGRIYARWYQIGVTHLGISSKCPFMQLPSFDPSRIFDGAKGPAWDERGGHRRLSAFLRPRIRFEWARTAPGPPDLEAMQAQP